MTESPSLLISDLLNQLEAESARSGIPLNDYLMLLCDVMGESRTGLYLRRGECLTTEQADLFSIYRHRLRQNEPVQYILGKAYFYGREFIVSPAVLIPRPETEGLVELVLSQVKPGMRVLDIGTGSGVIAITLKAVEPSLFIDATDISPDAVAIAARNADRYRCDIRFSVSDLYPPDSGHYDIVVSNPPYISFTEYASLPPQIREYEPESALLAGEDGLLFYRRILGNQGGSGTSKRSSTRFFFEIGSTQAERLIKLVHDAGFYRIEIKKDLNGLDRFAIVN